MNVYRAYFLGRDGKIFKAEVLECETDDEAIELAKPMVDGHDIEVWHGSRRITQLQHNQK